MEYGAPWRECDPRMYDFTEQSLPEPWEPRGRFHFPGHGEGRRRFSRWPDHQFSGHSSIDEYLLNSRSAYTPPCWHDRPFRDQYATHLPYRTRVDFFNIFRSRSEGHGTHPPSYPHAFTNAEQSHANPLRYSFFNNSHADDVWPRATGASEGTVYPDSIEEPSSDDATALPNHKPHPANEHGTKTPRPDLPPLRQRCETIPSSTPPTSPPPSPSSRKSSLSDAYPSFDTFSFPSRPSSAPSTPSRPGSSTPPVSPRTNDPSSEHRRRSEQRRIRHAWRSVQRAKRKLEKEQRKLRLRERLLVDREMDLEIRAEKMFGVRGGYGWVGDRDDGDGEEGWWCIPGILDPGMLD